MEGKEDPEYEVIPVDHSFIITNQDHSYTGRMELRMKNLNIAAARK